jgi:hypothetical protein
MTEEERKLVIKLDRLERRIGMAQTYLQVTQGELYDHCVKTIARLTKQYAKLGGKEKMLELLNTNKGAN